MSSSEEGRFWLRGRGEKRNWLPPTPFKRLELVLWSLVKEEFTCFMSKYSILLETITFSFLGRLLKPEIGRGEGWTIEGDLRFRFWFSVSRTLILASRACIFYWRHVKGPLVWIKYLFKLDDHIIQVLVFPQKTLQQFVINSRSMAFKTRHKNIKIGNFKVILLIPPKMLQCEMRALD